MKITTADIPALLESAWDARDDLVLCLLGLPGIGKTQQLYQFAERKDAKVVEIIASQILPNEVSGITMPVNETHSMDVFDHARLSSLKDGDILFFDELLQASPQTLSACLTLIQERRMMSGRMLPDVMIVAAANHLSSPTMVPMQIRQRFMFVDIEWDFNAWREYNEDMFGVAIDDDFKSHIRFNDNEYNVLTPRTMSKLLSWRESCSNEPAKLDIWKQYVSEEFGKLTASAIDGLFHKSVQQQVSDAIIDMYDLLEQDIPEELVLMLDSIKDVPVRELYSKLMELDEWPEIEKALSARIKE